MLVIEFTDPGCPWAWSGEPARRRIRALYPQLEWEVRLVGLAETGEVQVRKGITIEFQSKGWEMMRERYGMPIDARLREREAGTWGACRVAVAAKLQAPEALGRVLRALRLRHFGGELLDDPAMFAAAMADAGVSLDLDDPAVDVAFRADMEAARTPRPEALALRHKLAQEDGRWRYTCPSWEITGDEGRAACVPGFQPVESYEVALANLDPSLQRSAEPSVQELLRSAPGEPLATREVAVACGLSDEDAVAALREAGATARPLGQSEVWTA